MNKITNSFDISYLRSLREQGHTNLEIANLAGISSSSVSRYLGKMTKEERAASGKRAWANNRRSKASSAVATPVTHASPKPIRNLRIMSVLMQMKGKYFSYFVDTAEQTITFSRESCPDLILKMDEVDEFMEELEELHTAMGATHKTKEVNA